MTIVAVTETHIHADYLSGTRELAEAIINGAENKGLTVEMVDHATPITGKGIRAQVDGQTVAVGSADLLDVTPDNTRILERLAVDRTHVMVRGRMVAEGPAELIADIDANGGSG